jgi:YVTN family beta-propeller protein
MGVCACVVTVSPDSAHTYVTTNSADGTVTVIDTATNTVSTTIPVGPRPVGVAVSPDGAQLYVTNSDDGTVSVIDTATNTVSTTIAVGSSPLWAAVSPSGTRVYVTNSGDNTISVISTEPEYTSPSQGLTGALIGAIDRDGGGWLVIGNKFIPIPPRSPVLSIIAEAAAAHVGNAIENVDMADQIRQLLQT